ncbi:MAG: hypothetical protein HY902_19305 [Deltaproteobacteria bacterium]|nr:hypothetical protein [Deltaproteobacteria bacterium]
MPAVARRPRTETFKRLRAASFGAWTALACSSPPAVAELEATGAAAAETTAMPSDVSAADGQSDASVQPQCVTDKDCKKLPGTGLSPCQVRVCQAGECAVTIAAKGTPCSDGKACTTGDVCAGTTGGAAACTGTFACPTPPWKDSMCVVAKCADDGSGECQYANAVPGTPCDDKDPCTLQDKCVAGGKCGAGQHKTCPDDGNACTLETCVTTSSGGTCATVQRAAGDPCADGNPCTEADHCDAAANCLGSLISCGPSPSPCVLLYCDAVKGCSNKPQNNGAPCNDGDPAPVNDACSNVVCAGTP